MTHTLRRRARYAVGAALLTAISVAGALPSGKTVLPPTAWAPSGGGGDGMDPDAAPPTPVDRAVLSGDLLPLGAPAVPAAALTAKHIRVVNPVVSNLDTALTVTDRVDDTEPVIAVNPRNPAEIVLQTGRDGWEAWRPGGCKQSAEFCPQGAGNARGSIWYSRDGGETWGKYYSIPIPPGANAGVCTCDRVVAWANDGKLINAFLVFDAAVHAASTTDPSDPGRWVWPLDSAGKSVPVARHEPLPLDPPGDVGNYGFIDQPMVVTGPDPLNPGVENVYISYTDDGTRGYNQKHPNYVAVSRGTGLRFTERTQITQVPVCCDDSPATSAQFFGHTVPTLRLAADRRSGVVYALWGVSVGLAFTGPRGYGQQFDTLMGAAGLVEQRLTRSVDGGRTWTLGGSRNGIVVDRAFSQEKSTKFATFSGLYGGTHSAAVDPSTGDVYFAYADLDLVTKKNRMAVRRITFDEEGNATVGAKTHVSGQVDAALPWVAVLDNGTVGVLYDQFDGLDNSGYPVVSVRLARSTDHGVTFDDTLLTRFTSVEKENVDDVRQRPLGDYQQMVAQGNTFYGVFTANGAAFGRSVADWDPVFFRAGPAAGNRRDRRTESPSDPMVPLLGAVMVVAMIGARPLGGRDAL